MAEWGDDEPMPLALVPIQPNPGKVPGLNGSVANIPSNYDVEILKEWFKTIAPLTSFHYAATKGEYLELRMVDFSLKLEQNQAELIQSVMEHWIPSSMWLHLAAPKNKDRRTKVRCRRIRGGCWDTIQGQTNIFLSRFCLWKKDCFFYLDVNDFGAFFRYSTADESVPTTKPAARFPRQENFLEIRLTTWQIRKFVLVDNFKDGNATAYLTLKHPPKLTNMEYSTHTDVYKRDRRNSLPGVSLGILGTSLVYAVDLCDSDLTAFLDLMAQLRIRVWYTKVHVVEHKDALVVDTMNSDLRSMDLEDRDVHDEEDLAYAWRCITSASCYQQKYRENISSLISEYSGIKECVRLLYALADELDNSCFCSFSRLLSRAKKSRWVQSSTKTIDEGACWVKRVLITPTRIVFCTPDLLQVPCILATFISLRLSVPLEIRNNKRICFSSNAHLQRSRVLRNYPPQAFMRVSFRDEGFTKIVGGSDEVSNLMKRISIILNDGIYIGRFHYQFLTSTSSQIRDHSVWFVRSNLLKETSRNSAQKIRDWMGDFSGDRHALTSPSCLSDRHSIAV